MVPMTSAVNSGIVSFANGWGVGAERQWIAGLAETQSNPGHGQPDILTQSRRPDEPRCQTEFFAETIQIRMVQSVYDRDLK
ncbi:hypothetical protein K227x_04500 [Rubripirellula lacrimiformis]|uniref:Uncharacterized protein n=1 Tax=Rubripirellula lacrimiformis TaxID=1930273 RepID=A0A517N4L7_9BACT|nr:hypothetical protein K227x_04500 [Rubripirellula lacrimiformis]